MTTLDAIDNANQKLASKYVNILEVNPDLDRRLVSYQANKTTARHRWCKYKEGFSAALIRYMFDHIHMPKGAVLDPFAGSGTTLFVASEYGRDSTGIELLPHSADIIRIRRDLKHSDESNVAAQLRSFAVSKPWESSGKTVAFNHLRITSGAFPPETLQLLERYLWELTAIDNILLQRVLRFACMCVLEVVSFTRKDGQYLRWDYRSGRGIGKKKFDKGKIYTFTEAVVGKLNEIADDLEYEEPCLFKPNPIEPGKITLLEGSCLSLLPRLKAQSFSGLITSPPYCNRYDYTRTYALELAFLGVGEDHLKQLRQTMLSCTVENRFKDDLDESSQSRRFKASMEAWQNQPLLRLIVDYLNDCKKNGTLNNNGIPRMVDSYFREMALMIFESSRVLKSGAPLIMVNDNVRYQGALIPVDLILAEFAQSAGLEMDRIWVLPRGKGNSSQQMGLHGRSELRKCVYIWRKPAKVRRANKPDRQVALVR